MLRTFFIVLVFVRLVSASCQPNLNATVQTFTFSGGSRVDAILELGKQTNICFGLRNLPRSAFVEPASFRLKNQTARLIIDKIFDGERVDIKQRRRALCMCRGLRRSALYSITRLQNST